MTFDGIESAVVFAENVGWPIWAKGRNYEAVRAASPLELSSAVEYLKSHWPAAILLQKDVLGSEESIAFAAFEGDLVAACYMRKTNVTNEGKTWGGRVTALDETQTDRLRRLVRQLSWTGGGEIEMIKSRLDGSLNLIDVNPRFPAWIYGAALAGYNLPAALVAKAAGLSFKQEPAASEEFVRVVEELSWRGSSGDAMHSSASFVDVGNKGHPSGMPLLARRLVTEDNQCLMIDDLEVSNDTAALDRAISNWPLGSQGPERVQLSHRLDERMAALATMASSLSESKGIDVEIAYSIKTNPSESVLASVRSHGLAAEAISLAEVSHAMASGFVGSELTLNGPGKWWPAPILQHLDELARVNCDSLDDLTRTIDILEQKSWSKTELGFRIAPLSFQSRFGIDLDDLSEFRRLCDLLRPVAASGRRIGFHFHFASSRIGLDRWQQQLRAVSVLATAVQDSIGAGLTFVDIGGGWRQTSLALVQERIAATAEDLKQQFPELQKLVIEPGKLAIEESETVVASVLERRKFAGQPSVILSAALSDIPDSSSFPHEILWRAKSGTAWKKLPAGSGYVLGRICMEHDVIRRSVWVPDELAAGDFIAIRSTGAYDSSMQYSFGRGGRS